MKRQRSNDALTQDSYARAVLDKFGMADARSVEIPAQSGPTLLRSKKFCRQRAYILQGWDRFPSLDQEVGAAGHCSFCDGAHWEHVQTMSKSDERSETSASVRSSDDLIRITHSEDAEDGDELPAYVDSNLTSGWCFSRLYMSKYFEETCLRGH